MNWQSYFLPQRLVLDSSDINARIEVVESYGRRRLLVNGIEQTGGYTESLFQKGLQTLVSWHMGPMKRITIIGVGGGGIFPRLRKLYPEAHCTGVDIDAKIIHIAKEYFNLKTVTNTSLLTCDAREFAGKKEHTRKFDCVIVDIYTGNDVPEFVTGKRFVQSLGKIIRKNGSVMINYFSFYNQKELSGKFQTVLSTVFAEVKREVNHKNIFFYCRK